MIRPLKPVLAAVIAVMLLTITSHAAFASNGVDDGGSRIIFTPPANDIQSIISQTYAQVMVANAPIFAEPSDAEIDVSPIGVTGMGFVWVSLADPQPVLQDGVAWYRINPNGYIRADYVRFFQPSLFHGVVISGQANLPFGWLVNGVRPSSAPGVPAAKGTTPLPRYALVTVYETRPVGDWQWYRIGDNQWVEQRQVGLVKPTVAPSGVPEGDKWIEVNLYEQTLAAYEGNRMVYATLISSGLPPWFTPTGLTRIWAKVTNSKMSGRDGFADFYFLPDVPWIMYFNQSVALHAAYWHDRFGAPHSHGCVNLAPIDAYWLYNWTTPTNSPGIWTMPKPDNPGSWVWVH